MWQKKRGGGEPIWDSPNFSLCYTHHIKKLTMSFYMIFLSNFVSIAYQLYEKQFKMWHIPYESSENWNGFVSFLFQVLKHLIIDS